MKKINQLFPLIAEPHPENFGGYAFLTLVRYNDEDYITIIDNVVKGEIIAYVLDFCSKEFESKPQESEEAIIKVAIQWNDTAKGKYPISVEFARQGLGPITSRIVRKFQVDYVTRVIGPMPEFNMGMPHKIKKRKKKSPPKGIEVIYRSKHPH